SRKTGLRLQTSLGEGNGTLMLFLYAPVQKLQTEYGGGKLNRYPIKRKLQKSVNEDLLFSILKEEFNEARKEGEKAVTSYGALERLECWLEGKTLIVDTRSRKDVDDALALDTISKYNRFLERVTGYTSKERRKAAMKVE
ncbi:MAG: DUF5611 family protein, partial [Methanomassiliicoccales archaeon]